MAAPSGTQKRTFPVDAGTGSGTEVEKLPSVAVTSQPADGERWDPPDVLDVARLHHLNALIHREKVDVDELQRQVEKDNHVNLMNDPLLSVVIACGKTDLAKSLIAKISDDRLTDSNYDGDTALHVAAAMGDPTVALELILRVPNLVHVRNRKQEIPLHKAALYGLRDMFWLLVANASSPDARREDGASMLHCAIMCNAPALALEIAKTYPDLITSVDVHGVTSLDLMLTNPRLFRSKTVLGFIESFLYDLIPLEEDRGKADDEDAAQEAATSSNDSVSTRAEATKQDAQQRDHESLERPRGICSRFLPHYATLIDLLELIWMIARWILFSVVKQFYRTIERLKEAKRRHKAALELIMCFAQSECYYFLFGRIHGPPKDRPNFEVEIAFGESRRESEGSDSMVGGGPGGPPVPAEPEKTIPLIKRMTDKLYKLASEEPETPASTAIKEAAQSVEKVLKALSPSSEERWNEPPLIKAVEMGLHEFVDTILRVCPQSAIYRDAKGRDVLQVAVTYRRDKIVKLIWDMRTTLPSWLFSRVDPKTGNTILHLASGGSPDAAKEEHNESDALQMQYDLVWFEKVESIIPKELVFRRNRQGMTAQELFTSSHKRMCKSSFHELVGMANGCAGAMAAVVFAMSSSFTHTDNAKTSNSPVFKTLSYSYVIGLSFAATSLYLLVSLVSSSYKEKEFRRANPTKLFLACLTFYLALVTLLLAFTVNTFLQIYGVEGAKEKHAIIFMLLLITCPVLTCLLFFFVDAVFGISRRFL